MHTATSETVSRPGHSESGGSGSAAVVAEPVFTSLEQKICDRLVLGETNEQIGNLVHRSEKTVKAQITSILKKLGASNRTQAALILAGVLKIGGGR